jgi:protein-disulfide isomerase
LLLGTSAVGFGIRKQFITAQRAGTDSYVVPEWEKYASGGFRIGPAHAPVAVIVFSDFSCSFCRTVASDLRYIRAEHHDSVAEIYRNFPLTSHQVGRAAAEASVCASQQGAFAAYHDQLFAHQEDLRMKPWVSFAKAVGVPDLTVFESCLRDSATARMVSDDSMAGAELGVQATPTVLVNELLFVGAPGRAALARAVDEQLKKSRALRTAGER